MSRIKGRYVAQIVIEVNSTIQFLDEQTTIISADKEAGE